MPGNVPVKLPSGYAPAYALGFSSPNGSLSLVSGDDPLPVSIVGDFSGGGSGGPDPVVLPSPLTGTAIAATVSAPFVPATGVPVTIALAGTWTGSVQVLRSTDGGTTRLPLTAGGLPWGRFTANACEQVWSEEGSAAQLFLDIAVTSGTVTYSLSQ